MEALIPGILKPAPCADQAPRDWLVTGEQVEPGICGDIHVTATTVWETRARLSILPSGGLSFPTCDMGQTMGVPSTVEHCENDSSVPVCVC